VFVERTLGLALVRQSWSHFLDFWPRAGCITLPILPVPRFGAVKVHDDAGGSVTLDAASYAVDALSEPVRLVLKAVPATQARELNAFEVDFTADTNEQTMSLYWPLRTGSEKLRRRLQICLEQESDRVPAVGLRGWHGGVSHPI